MANDEPTSGIVSTPKGGLYGGIFDPTGLGIDPNTLALLVDARWTTTFEGPIPATTIPYAFPAQASDYTSGTNYPGPQYLTGFAQLTADQMAASRTSFDLVESYTNLVFVPAASGFASDAAIRVSQTGYIDPQFGAASWGSFPYYGGAAAGDLFLGSNGGVPSQFFGTDGFNTIMHELGHTLGFKHGHDPSPNGTLAPQYNDNEFSVMTYASYLGANTSGATEAWLGSSPQSYMMFDIAALQALYGANFSKVGSRATYTWDNATGQEFINGRNAPDTGVTSTHKIFSTVWTAGAVTTYDLSNFSDNQVDDLRPGHWLTFSHAQIADLNNQAATGSPQFQAQGNVYNSLLYHGNTDSEITTLITGIGNDTLIGNDLDNVLNAGAGNDSIIAGTGDDIMIGGAGADSIYFHFGNGIISSGHDILRDTPANLNGDQVWGFGSGFTSTVDIQGVQFNQVGLLVSGNHQSTTLSSDGATALLNGLFTNGEFMIDTRGSGDQEHTAVSFVQYMPTLTEGRAVNSSVLNGVGNQPFLTGDGSVRFTLTFDKAISSFDNAFGYYQVSADGTIHDARLLFGNTHNVPVGQTVDLGAPGNNERIGFFLIQNGFDKYGALPNDLYFLSPSTHLAANLNSSSTPVLLSASQGTLTAAQIFHSFDSLNPGSAPQVLSGVSPGSHDLQIGFEDLQNGQGDNDFQDVVVSIHASHGYLIG